MATLSLLTTSIPEYLAARPLSALQGPDWLSVGQPFPDLLLPRLSDGEPSSIAALRGEKVILHLFASW